MRTSASFLVAVSAAAAGCGYTLRAGVGPTLDSDGHPGLMARVEAGLAFGMGDTYSFVETAGLSGGAGAGYGDGSPPLAAGLLVGLDVARQPDDADWGVRVGPTFRLEGPSEGEEEERSIFAAGGRVALLRVLGDQTSSKTWSGSESEKGGYSFHASWRTLRQVALEGSAELLWHDARGQRLRFALLIGYEKTGLLGP